MITITTEQTLNPDCLKFNPGLKLTSGRSLSLVSTADLEQAPIAQCLFSLEGVETIHIAPDFVSVTKNPNQSWDQLRTQILSAMLDFFSSGVSPVIESKIAGSAETQYAEDDAEIIQQIQELIETRIRPAVARDGGNVRFHSFENGIVQLEMQGACSGCPSATATLKHGIEALLRHYIPEIEAVEAIPA